MQDVRDALATVIHDSGYKQAVVAGRSGLTPQQLTDILKKRRRLEANELYKLCNALNITPNELYGIPK